ncbi:MAG: hypothetical protein R3B38_00325 [Patescibacteria group bacterium]
MINLNKSSGLFSEAYSGMLASVFVECEKENQMCRTNHFDNDEFLVRHPFIEPFLKGLQGYQIKFLYQRIDEQLLEMIPQIEEVGCFSFSRSIYLFNKKGEWIETVSQDEITDGYTDLKGMTVGESLRNLADDVVHYVLVIEATQGHRTTEVAEVRLFGPPKSFTISSWVAKMRQRSRLKYESMKAKAESETENFD